MRIAINAINDNDLPRGPDRYLVELLKSIADIDHANSYIVFHAPWQNWYREVSCAANFHFVVLDAPRRRSLRVPWQALAFPAIVRRYRPDVIHLPNTILMWPIQCPVVMTIHDLAEFTFPEKFNLPRAWGRRFLAVAAARVAHRLIAVSDYTRQEIIRTLGTPAEKISVVREGVSPRTVNETDCQDVRRRHQLSKEYLLYVGVLERTKNVEGIVEAFATAGDDLRERFDLVLAGRPGNAYDAVMRAIDRHQLKDSVRYLGYVDEGDLPCLLASARAFAFPSFVEGFGLVLLEAMSCGTPVVTSDAGALAEVAGTAALRVNPGDMRALRDGMRRVAFDEELRLELSERGRRRAEEFSWSRAARQMVGIYCEVGRTNLP